MMSIRSTLQLTNINQVLFTEPVMKRSDSEFAAFKQPEVWIRPDLNYCLKLLPREIGNLILSYTDAYLDWYLEDIQKKYGDKFLNMVLRSIPRNIDFAPKRQLLTIGRFLGTLNEKNKTNGFDCIPYPVIHTVAGIQVKVNGTLVRKTKITAGIIVRTVKVYLEKRKAEFDLEQKRKKEKREELERKHKYFKAECKVGDIIQSVPNGWGDTILITKVNDKTVSGIRIMNNVSDWSILPEGKWRLNIEFYRYGDNERKQLKFENIFIILPMAHQVNEFNVRWYNKADYEYQYSIVPYIRNSMEKQFKLRMDFMNDNS